MRCALWAMCALSCRLINLSRLVFYPTLSLSPSPSYSPPSCCCLVLFSWTVWVCGIFIWVTRIIFLSQIESNGIGTPWPNWAHTHNEVERFSLPSHIVFFLCLYLCRSKWLRANIYVNPLRSDWNNADLNLFSADYCVRTPEKRIFSIFVRIFTVWWNAAAINSSSSSANRMNGAKLIAYAYINPSMISEWHFEIHYTFNRVRTLFASWCWALCLFTYCVDDGLVFWIFAPGFSLMICNCHFLPPVSA